MLVLSRKVGERFMIGNEIVVQVLHVDGHRIRIGIDAPSHVNILREEICAKLQPAVVSGGPGKSR